MRAPVRRLASPSCGDGGPYLPTRCRRAGERPGGQVDLPLRPSRDRANNPHRWTPSSPSWSISSTYKVPFARREVMMFGIRSRRRSPLPARIRRVRLRRRAERKPVSWLRILAIRPTTTDVGTACIGCSGPPNGVGDQAVGEHRQVRDARPCGSRRRPRCPASATTNAVAVEEHVDGVGVDRWMPTPHPIHVALERQMSATFGIGPWRFIRNSRPKRSATGSARPGLSRRSQRRDSSLGSVGPPL